MRLCTFVRFETMIWPSIRFDISLQNFKKSSDIFSPQIERKRFKEYLVIILAVKESFERFSCLEFIFENSKHPEAGLRILRDTLIVTCLREWKLLSLYMFLRIIFLLLNVSRLYCNFNRCAVCFQSLSVNIAFTSTQTAVRIKRFWRLHIDKINKKINIINYLLCWSETLSMFIQTVDHSSLAAKVRTGWPYSWFMEIILTV